MSNYTTPPETIELWIRSFAPASAGPTQERALECLAELESNAPVDVAVDVWGAEVEVDRADAAMAIPQLERIESRLEAFESWASETGRDLEPFFRSTHVESMITDESRDVWRLPTIALAEFDEDGDLRHVAPCCNGDRTVDVLDRLETLAERVLPALEDESTFGDEPGFDDRVPDRLPRQRTDYRRDRIDPQSSRSD